MKLIEGKAAIITGAGRGIGRSVANLFVQHGASVLINDLEDEVGNEVAAAITAEGGRAAACNGSVADEKFPDELIDTALKQFGRLDIIVNNAGYTWDAVVHNMTDSAWESMIAIHMTAPFRIIRAASSYFRETAKEEIANGKSVHRKIINVSSV
ncbi:MAG TPA: SDR family NAD(P)-dependent oxidoreductase, partial [Pyrinomonadaceae bacterium]|nr:SDR family NAD(P)-dependent oxidoreductase [Pyrinomonadaceae bacterium]